MSEPSVLKVHCATVAIADSLSEFRGLARTARRGAMFAQQIDLVFRNTLCNHRLECACVIVDRSEMFAAHCRIASPLNARIVLANRAQWFLDDREADFNRTWEVVGDG